MFDRNQRPTSPATARTTASRSAALRLGRRVLVLGAMVATLATGTAGTAQAWSYARATGSAATVSLPRVNASDLFYNYAATLTIDTTIGPLVYRSPATTGGQDVVAVYSLEKWNGSSWSVVSQATASGRIAAGYGSVRLARASFRPTSGAGYYRVSWAFGWTVAGSGTTLGTGYLLASSTSDFACVTTLRPCQVSAGYVRVGRLYQLGGGW